MALPKEPRQKMINMMYLVLTALLALNVSSEILNAFKVVDASLVKSSNTIEEKNATIFASFEQKMNDAQTKELAAKWYPAAQAAKKLADETFSYIEQMKKQLKVESGLEVEDGVEKYKEDDLDAPTRYLVEGPTAKGKELLAKLQAFKSNILKVDENLGGDAFLATSFSGKSGLPLDLEIPKAQKGNEGLTQPTWEGTYFHMTPTVAAITILSKFQNDVRNSEAIVVDALHKKVGEVKLVYDEFAALAGTNSKYLLPGEELEITAGIGAFSKQARPTVTIDGANVPLNDEGMAVYKANVGGSGLQSKMVKITYKKPDGTTATVDKKIEYTVGQPAGLTVATDKTRVFYTDGAPNEISVTGQGGAEQLNVSITGPGVVAQQTSKGHWLVKCSQPGVTAVVNASDGKNKTTVNIPVKRVPNPIAKVGGKAGGDVASNWLRAQAGVGAILDGFVFEGIGFNVSEYRIYFSGTAYQDMDPTVVVKGNMFTPQVKSLMAKLQAGDAVLIDQIRVAPTAGGQTRILDQGISFVIE